MFITTWFYNIANEGELTVIEVNGYNLTIKNVRQWIGDEDPGALTTQIIMTCTKNNIPVRATWILSEIRRPELYDQLELAKINRPGKLDKNGQAIFSQLLPRALYEIRLDIVGSRRATRHSVA